MPCLAGRFGGRQKGEGHWGAVTVTHRKGKYGKKKKEIFHGGAGDHPQKEQRRREPGEKLENPWSNGKFGTKG